MIFSPVFALLSEVREELKELVNNLLLVAGGFLVGYLLGGLIGWAIGKWALKQQAPDTVVRIGRPVGGIILAFIVALIVFTGKGRSPGDGGDGKGSTSPDASSGKNSTPNVEPSPKDVKIAIPKVDQTPADLTISVTILAGSAVKSEGKFYVLDNDVDRALSLAEVKKAIEERKGKVKGKTVLAILFPSDPNLAPPRNDKKVTDITRWATEEAGLDVTFPASR